MYTCPMHPEVQSDHPGICPICGMNLEPVYITPEQDNSEYNNMLNRFLIGLFLTIPILFLSTAEMLQMTLPFSNTISHWLQLILCTPIILWCGWPFFERAWYSILNRSLNMFTLIAMGIGTAYFYSTFATLFPDLFPDSFKENGKLFIYFEAAAVITVLVLLGQVLELKAKSQTSHAIQSLLNHAAKTALIIVNGMEKSVPVDDVRVGDLIRVKPGEKIPVDGEVVEGSSLVDESMITGESVPVQKVPENSVTGGTINLNGTFIMKATQVGNETVLARIVKMVSEAQRSKAPIQKLADVISGYFVPIVVLVAILTFIGWSLFGPEPHFVYALINAVAVLIIACPCALGLATPMSIMVGVGKGASMGILIKNADALERLEKVDTVVVDKTGTLTEGKPRIIQIHTNGHWPENELLRLTAAVEASSEHPIAFAIIEEAKKRNLDIPRSENFQSSTGEGIMGVVEGKSIIIGKSDFLKSQSVLGVLELKSHAFTTQEGAQTTFFIGINGQAAGFIVVADPIKINTLEAITELHRLGIKVIMLTGDNEKTAQAVAKTVSIDKVYAEVTPKDKNAVIQKLRAEDRIVAMAGDGINDAPALASADVGIAMGNGTDVAMESAGITLVKGDLNGIVKAIKLSHATMRNIRQNLFFAFIYNMLGVPIAAGILFPFLGVLLNPMLASAAMSISSASVIFNALRLNRGLQ